MDEFVLGDGSVVHSIKVKTGTTGLAAGVKPNTYYAKCGYVQGEDMGRKPFNFTVWHCDVTCTACRG